MCTSMVKSKFLSNPEDIGVVAVGFSGGQVSSLPPYLYLSASSSLSLNPSLNLSLDLRLRFCELASR